MTRTIALNVAVAAVYALSAAAGLTMDAVSGFATLVWPATGIALAAILRGGYRLWPGIAAGALVANLWNGAPLPVACGIATGNTLEAVLGAYALQRVGFDLALARLRDVLALAVLAALAAPVVSATIGVCSLLAGGLVAPAGFVETWRAWWVGDAIGALVVAPLLLVWHPRDLAGGLARPRRAAEAVAIALSIAGVSLFAFGVLFGDDDSPLRQPYAVFPLFIWAAVRFEQRGATAATLLVAAVAILAVVLDRGPFARGPLHEGLLHLQVFIAAISATALVLGAVIAENAELQRRAQAAIAARDEFLDVASHELRTPTNALLLQLGSLQHLFSTRDPAGEDELGRRADGALHATRRLASLIESLLDISRLHGGRLELHLGPCDLAEVAADVVERLGEHAREAGAVVRVHAPEPVVVRADRLRLEQLLFNLVSNAIKYGPERPIDVTVAASGDRATIAVEDRGIGIATEHLDRIFDRFARAASIRSYGGLGLGLYVAREIVLAHGGTMRVQSVLGEGAKFTVELPRAVPAA